MTVLSGCQPAGPARTGPRNVEILFLGHASTHHNSAQYMPLLAAALAKEGIHLTYTDTPDALNPETLSLYDGLIVYANHDSITTAQEKALLDFVAAGKGFIPIHSASYCFRNSDAYVALVGAQFKEHGTGTFTAAIVDTTHAALHGVAAFETWDETYVHHRHNPDRTVLMERVDGDHREPWTWARTHGKGRVFYTAYGHDERTWSQPAFHALIKSGILWAVGDAVRAQWAQLSFEPLRYTEAHLPNYEKRDPPPKQQQPLSPDQSQAYIQLPPGFDLQLFAAEPDIVKPVAMAWDERGRLWIAETTDYPNAGQPEGQGRDRIKILEDTDGDGRADAFTVFADGLSIPTSLTFARGGVVVAQAPHFLFLKDTDGDDRADVREILVTGWGTSDTHAGPSNLKYGLDNWIWGTVGYADFEGTVGGQDLSFPQGIYRLAPDGSALEFLTRFSNNTWGLGFSETFDVFGSTANNTHSVFMGIPNRYYEGVEGLRGAGSRKIDGHYAMHPITPNVRQVDVFGGFTAAAGHNLYTARSFPRAYWNRIAFVNEPTGHLLHRAILEEDGSGFVEQDGWNMLASADEWVAPIYAEVGPDGALWVIDWYNFIVQHNPRPEGFEMGQGNAYVTPLRDKQHGRIYRLVYNDAPAYQPLSLDLDDPDGLVEALTHDNMFWRTTAQRLLVERGQRDVLPHLYALVQDRRVDEIGLNGAALHALWTMHGLQALDGRDAEALDVARGALSHPAAGVRKAALQVLPPTEASLAAVLAANVLHDPDLHTRLAAFLAVSEMPPSAEAGAALYEESKKQEVIDDVWLPQALFIAAQTHRAGFVQAYRNDADAQVEQVAASQSEVKEAVDWHRADLDASVWKTMALPRYWEAAGLGGLDGVVWFRKTITLPDRLAGRSATLHLGPINESDATWINGRPVGETVDDYDEPRVYAVPAGALKPGANVIAVRVEDRRGSGGLWGAPEQLHLAVGDEQIPLAGDWQYNVEEEFLPVSDLDIQKDRPIAQQFLAHNPAAGDPEETTSASAADAPEDADILTISLSVVNGELAFDKTTFTVEAGKPVRLVFENADLMQHNLLLLKPGTLDDVGQRADAMATDPQAAARHYVPDTPNVLISTKLLDPNTTETLTFTAPAEPGDYPYICTFPGHWRTMQGVMKVVGSASRP